ncbi:sigma factor-like helix-turn-helix DNA-binding protein [Bradyrhizobium sp. LB14.3]|uniref:sigma factor-like helix-turn-helix DNA-binding protein n=1 Tax=Bradyrhizobium sp. LB14.3 TaxID=3156328 RepID=UPI0033940310
MRHIREVLRLHDSVGMSQRAVACSLGLAQGTVSKYLNRARRAGLTWPLPPELDDDVQLENHLFPPPSDRPSDERPHPDRALVHRELRRPNVTLMLLWEEYCDANSDSFSHAWFCERYKEWTGRLKPTLRQVHVAGEKLFVDYSGHTMEVVDGLSGGCAACRSSSPCSAPRTTPMPKPASARACRTGSPACPSICLFRWRGPADGER